MRKVILFAAALLLSATMVSADPGRCANGQCSKGNPATGTDYYFPGVDIQRLSAEDAPQTCFWKYWTPGGPFHYSSTFPQGSGNTAEMWASYWPAKFKVPAGSTLVMKGEFPYARYTSLELYSGPTPLGGIAGFRYEPDPGSTNTMMLGAKRRDPKRSYTLYLVDEEKPAVPAANTLYMKAGASSSPQSAFSPSELRFRVYFADRGRDVTGDVGLPRLAELRLADGTVLERESDICGRINMNTTEHDQVDASLPVASWDALVAAAPDPTRAPAQDTPLWERFFNPPYSYFSLYLLPGGEALRNLFPAGGAGGGGGSFTGTLANTYLASFLSHETVDREIAVTYVRVPNTPQTYDGPSILQSPGPLQAQYWSLCSNVPPHGNPLTPEGFPSGTRVGMCHNDETVVLDSQRWTRLVHSQPDKRPWNATNKCGWSWLNSGPGDNLGRPIVTLASRPALDAEPDFNQSSSNVVQPGTETQVMGDYLPTTHYMSKAEFEAMGCQTDGFVQPAGRPDLPAPVWGTEQTIKPVYPEVRCEPDTYFPPNVFGVLQVLSQCPKAN
jgi:hypothetical protein